MSISLRVLVSPCSQQLEARSLILCKHLSLLQYTLQRRRKVATYKIGGWDNRELTMSISTTSEGSSLSLSWKLGSRYRQPVVQERLGTR